MTCTRDHHGLVQMHSFCDNACAPTYFYFLALQQRVIHFSSAFLCITFSVLETLVLFQILNPYNYVGKLIFCLLARELKKVNYFMHCQNLIVMCSFQESKVQTSFVQNIARNPMMSFAEM